VLEDHIQHAFKEKLVCDASSINRYGILVMTPLVQIKALKNFGYVKAGDLGGYIEQESNLSQKDDCWVADNAKVYGNAEVQYCAKVSGNAEVRENARIYGYAKIYEHAEIYGKAEVSGYAEICGYAQIGSNCIIN